MLDKYLYGCLPVERDLPAAWNEWGAEAYWKAQSLVP